MKIRIMQEEDLEYLSEIYVEVYTKFDVGETWDTETAYNLLKYLFNIQPDLAFVAEAEGKPVGAFIATIKPWCDGNLLIDGEIFVQPEFQKRKIGTELSKVMYKTAIDKYDITSIHAITFKKFEFPLKWYESQGFKEVENWMMLSGDARKILKKLEEK